MPVIPLLPKVERLVRWRCGHVERVKACYYPWQTPELVILKEVERNRIGECRECAARWWRNWW